MKDWLSIAEVSALTRYTEGALRKLCNSGKLKDIRRVEWASRTVWEIHRGEVDRLLGKSGPTYAELKTRWLDELVKIHRLKATTIERITFGHRTFWRCLAGNPKGWKYPGDEKMDLAAVTLDNIRQALINCGRPAAAQNIHESLLSFYKLLVREGLRPREDLEAFAECKPPKNKRPRRTFVPSADVMQRLIDENETWTRGRTKYDRWLTGAILLLARNTGMRNSEICNLKLQDVDFNRSIIHVVRGKGDKDRRIGIHPSLMPILLEAVHQRPESPEPNLFLQRDGRPLNRRCLSERIRDLAARINLDLTPHGLRRTFTTALLMEGHAVAKVQKITGHADITTLQLYDMSTDEDALDILRGSTTPDPSSDPSPPSSHGQQPHTSHDAVLY